MAAATEGWEPTLFSDTVHDFLLCGRCHKVVRDPRNCPNGHTFCKTCIESYVASHSTCPVDGASLDAARLARNIPVECMLNALALVCPNTTSGCTWRGKLEDLPGHQGACAFVGHPCSNAGCSEVLLLDAMERHRAVCPHRTVVCSFCRKSVGVAKLASHHASECTDITVACPNGCTIDEMAARERRGGERKEETRAGAGGGAGAGAGAGGPDEDASPDSDDDGDLAAIAGEEDGLIPRETDPIYHVKRSELAAHLLVCPAVAVECCYKHLGCKVRKRRGEMAEHEKDPVHMRLLFRENTRLKRRLGLADATDIDDDDDDAEAKAPPPYCPVWDTGFSYAAGLQFADDNKTVISEAGKQGLVCAKEALPRTGKTSWVFTVTEENLSDACVCFGIVAKPVPGKSYSQGNTWMYRVYNSTFYNKGSSGKKVKKCSLNEPCEFTYDAAANNVTMKIGGVDQGVVITGLPSVPLFVAGQYYGSSSRRRVLKLSPATGGGALPILPGATPAMAMLQAQIAELRALAASGGFGGGGGVRPPFKFDITNGPTTHFEDKHCVESNGHSLARSSTMISASGKTNVNFELVADKNTDEVACFGFVKAGAESSTSYNSGSDRWMYRAYNGDVYGSGKNGSKPKIHPGDKLRMEFDRSTKKVSLWVNGTSHGVIWNSLTTATIYPAVVFYGSSGRSPRSRVRFLTDAGAAYSAGGGGAMLAVPGGPLNFTIDKIKGPITRSDGNKTAQADGSAIGVCGTAIPDSGTTEITFKLVADKRDDEVACIGFVKPGAESSTGYSSGSDRWFYRCYNGQVYGSGHVGSNKSKVHQGDTVKLVFNRSSRTVTAYVNGSSQGNIWTSLHTGTIYPAVCFYGSSGRSPKSKIKILSASHSGGVVAAGAGGAGAGAGAAPAAALSSYVFDKTNGPVTMSEGNTKAQANGTAICVSSTKIPASGTTTLQYEYVTGKATDEVICFGFVLSGGESSTSYSSGSGRWFYRCYNGQTYGSGTTSGNKAKVHPGDKIKFVFDRSARKCTVFVNGSSQGVVWNSLTTSDIYPAICFYGSSGRNPPPCARIMGTGASSAAVDELRAIVLELKAEVMSLKTQVAALSAGGGVVAGPSMKFTASGSTGPHSISDGGLTVKTNGECVVVCEPVLPTAGVTRWKFKLDHDASNDERTCFGIVKKPVSGTSYDGAKKWFYRCYNGNLYGVGKASGTKTKIHKNDTVELTFDASAGTLAFSVNGTSQGVCYTGLTSGPYHAAVAGYASAGSIIKCIGGAGGVVAAGALKFYGSKSAGSYTYSSGDTIAESRGSAMCVTDQLITSGRAEWDVKVLYDKNSDEGICTGVVSDSASGTSYNASQKWMYRHFNGQIYLSGSSSGSNTKVHNGAVVHCVLDMSSRTVTFTVNGASQSNKLTGLPSAVRPAVIFYSSGRKVQIMNFRRM